MQEPGVSESFTLGESKGRLQPGMLKVKHIQNTVSCLSAAGDLMASPLYFLVGGTAL